MKFSSMHGHVAFDPIPRNASLKTLVLKLKIEPSAPNSFGRSFQSLAAAKLNDDCPIAEDIVSPKSQQTGIPKRSFM